MYRELTTAFKQAGQDDSVVTLITGAGKYFSSGNDLSGSVNIPPGEREKMAGKVLLRWGKSIKAYVFLQHSLQHK